MAEVPAGSAAAEEGLRKNDVIVACDGKPVRNIGDLLASQRRANGRTLKLTVIRQQKSLSVNISN